MRCHRTDLHARAKTFFHGLSIQFMEDEKEVKCNQCYRIVERPEYRIRRYGWALKAFLSAVE